MRFRMKPFAVLSLLAFSGCSTVRTARTIGIGSKQKVAEISVQKGWQVYELPRTGRPNAFTIMPAENLAASGSTMTISYSVGPPVYTPPGLLPFVGFYEGEHDKVPVYHGENKEAEYYIARLANGRACASLCIAKSREDLPEKLRFQLMSEFKTAVRNIHLVGETQ